MQQNSSHKKIEIEELLRDIKPNNCVVQSLNVTRDEVGLENPVVPTGVGSPAQTFQI